MKRFILLALLLLPLPLLAQNWQVGGGAVSPTFIFSCSPTTLNYGNITINSNSGALNSTCTNTGNQTLTITSEVLAGATYAYGAANTCTASISIIPTGTCKISVTFTPTSATTFTGTVVLTILGATGSPATINLTGVGVTSGGGGSAYTAPVVTTSIGYTGYSPISSSQLPAEGGVLATDSNFVHSSSGGISGGAYDAFFQCAGTAAASTAHGLWSGFATNASWRTNNTTTAHIITPDHKWIVLGSSSSAWGFFQITFTSTPQCALRELISPANVPFTPAVDGPVASHTGGSDQDLYYSINATGPGLVKCDFGSGTGPCTVTSLISNFNALSPAPCGITLGTSSNSFGYVRSTNDNSSLGHDNILIFAAGTAAEGQNNWECVMFYQMSTGAVAWWDTLTDACGSTTSPAWTGGWKSVSSGCTGQGSGRIHGLEEPDPTGTYVGVDDTANSQTIPTFFNISNQTFTAPTLTSLPSLGHMCAAGPNLLAFSSGNSGAPGSGAMNAVAFTAMTVAAFTAPRLGAASTGGVYQTDQHCTGATVNSTGASGTVWSLSYIGVASQCPGGTGPCPQPNGVGLQEGIMVSPPPSSGTWSPTYYRFFHSMADSITDSNFYDQVGGNIDPSGVMAAITTNWGCTLGQDNGGGGSCRKVVLIHELR